MPFLASNYLAKRFGLCTNITLFNWLVNFRSLSLSLSLSLSFPIPFPRSTAINRLKSIHLQSWAKHAKYSYTAPCHDYKPMLYTDCTKQYGHVRNSLGTMHIATKCISKATDFFPLPISDAYACRCNTRLLMQSMYSSVPLTITL